MQTFSEESFIFRFYTMPCQLHLVYLCRYEYYSFLNISLKNMKTFTAKMACLLLAFLVGTAAMAESITSPNGLLKLNFSVNAQGEPVYEL